MSAVCASQLQRHRGSAFAAEPQLVSSETSQAGWVAAGLAPLRTCPDTDGDTTPEVVSVRDETVTVKWGDEGEEMGRRGGDAGRRERCRAGVRVGQGEKM